MLDINNAIPLAALILSIAGMGYAVITFRQSAGKDRFERLEKELMRERDLRLQAERERDQAIRREMEALRRLREE